MDLFLAIVRALGVPDADVTAWSEAFVAVQVVAREGATEAVLHQLPADLVTFTGRENELGRLLEAALGGDGRAVVITAIEGMGGIGKTRLAVHAAHLLVARGYFPDGQLYANLRGFDPDRAPAEPPAVLDRFLRQLGVPGTQIPVDLEARAAMFRDRLLGKRVLLLLDNVADPEQVTDLLPANPECLVLITSRRTLTALDEAQLLQLGVFRTDEAVELLTRIGGLDRISAEPDAAAAVAEACGHLPIALALAAQRLRARPGWRVADLLAALRTSPLDAPTAGARTLRAVFDLSYQALPPDHRRMFRLLGISPGEDIATPAAAALAGMDADTALQARRTVINKTGAILERLCDEHLLQQPSAGRYTMHDLLRLYARELAAHEDGGPWPTAFDEAHDALQRLTSFYVDHTAAAVSAVFPGQSLPVAGYRSDGVARFADRAEAAAWLSAEKINLLATAQNAADRGPPEAAWQLALELRPYLWEIRDGGSMLQAAKAGARAAARSGDRSAEAAMLNASGTAKLICGDPAEALSDYKEAAQAARAIGDSRLASAALGNIALVCQQTNRPADALRYLQQAAEIDDSINRNPTRLSNLGVVLSTVGRLAEATTAHREALRIARETSSDYAEAVAHCNLAHVYIDSGRNAEALQHLDTALAGYRRVGSAYGETLARQLAGAAYAAAGNLDQALLAIDSAIALALEDNDRRLEGDSRCTRGSILDALHRPAEAAEEYRRAIQLATAVNSVEVRISAVIGLAALKRNQADSEQALAHAIEAVNDAERCGFRLLLGRALALRTKIHHDMRHKEQARQDASHALAIQHQTGMPVDDDLLLVLAAGEAVSKPQPD